MKAVIIGTSGGIGSALAAAIEVRGGEVVRLSRRSDPPPNLDDDDASTQEAARRVSDAVEMKRNHPATILVGRHPGTVDTDRSTVPAQHRQGQAIHARPRIGTVARSDRAPHPRGKLKLPRLGRGNDRSLREFTYGPAISRTGGLPRGPAILHDRA